MTNQIDNTGKIIIDNETINKEDNNKNNKYLVQKISIEKATQNTEIDERKRLTWAVYAKRKKSWE